MIDSINNSQSSEVCIVMLHGYGANKDDLFGLQVLFPETHVISLQGPLDLSRMGMPGGRAWFNLEFTSSGIVYKEEEILAVLEALTEELESIKSRFKHVILLGFSQGCILTHGLLLHNPELITAAICLSGRFSEKVFLEELKRDVDDKPIFISHGIYDEVIPIESGREIMAYYTSSKAVVTSKEYEMGHEISSPCVNDIQEWFQGLREKIL